MFRSNLLAAGLLGAMALAPAAAAPPTGVTLGTDRTVVAVPRLCITNTNNCLSAVGTYQGGRFSLSGDLGASVLGQSGADPTGATDSTSAITAAIAAAKSAGYQAYLPPGAAYKLSSGITLPANSSMDMASSVFTGTGFIGPVPDPSPQVSPFVHMWLQRTDKPNVTQTAILASMFIDPTHSTTAYEKSTATFQVETADASTTGANGISLDAVALLTQAVIAPNNLAGHLYAGNSYALYPCNPATSGGACTTDGTGEVWEFDSGNYSSNQSDPNSTLAKTGIGIVAQGSVPSTVGIHITSNMNYGWHDGIVVEQGTISNTVMRVIQAGTPGTDVFHILPSGSTLVNDLTDYTGTLTVPNGVLTLNSGGPQTTVNANNFGAQGYNSLGIQGAASTGTSPVIKAAGADANVGIGYQSQGTGAHSFTVGGVLKASISATGISTTGNISTSAAYGASAGSPATALTADYTILTGGTGGVIVPTTVFPTRRDVWNFSGAAIGIYPPASGAFMGSATNAPISVANNAHLAAICITAAFCVTEQ